MNVSSFPSYGVNISQLIHFARVCSNVGNFNKETIENMKVPRPLLSCRSDYFANMKLIGIVKTNTYFLHLFLLQILLDV